MENECFKCGYKSAKNKILFGKNLCEFCSYFAPVSEKEFQTYCEEKTLWRDIQTYRKQGKLGGIRQKNGMKQKAKEGKVMSRAPLGYEIKNNKLIPARNSHIIELIYEDFLNSKISLNRLSKKYSLSINGLKKVLTNFTYLGKIKFDGELNEGNHSPLISSTLFNHVQDKLEKLGIKRI